MVAEFTTPEFFKLMKIEVAPTIHKPTSQYLYV